MKSRLARLAVDRGAVRETEPRVPVPDLWNAMSDGGVIDQALSPKTRPDPCG